MGVEKKFLYGCDCKGYHPYKTGETYEPIGWITAVVNSDLDGNKEITIKKTENLSERETFKVEDRYFFVDMECFSRWADKILFPPEPAIEPPAPPIEPMKADNPETDTDDIPF